MKESMVRGREGRRGLRDHRGLITCSVLIKNAFRLGENDLNNTIEGGYRGRDTLINPDYCLILLTWSDKYS